jgi:hypothetical protein
MASGMVARSFGIAAITLRSNQSSCCTSSKSSAIEFWAIARATRVERRTTDIEARSSEINATKSPLGDAGAPKNRSGG